VSRSTRVDRFRCFGKGDRRPVTRCLWVVSLLFGMLSQSAVAQIAWELSPYRVSIRMAFSDVPELNAAVRQDSMKSMARQASAVFGAIWRTKVELAPDAWKPTMLARIEALRADMVTLDDPLPDKILAVAVVGVPGGLRVVAREFDRRILTWRKPVRHVVRQIALLDEITFQTVVEAFGPLARIEFLEHDRVRLHLRASSLPAGDPTMEQIEVGDVWRPFARRSERRGHSVQRGIRVIDWTFLVIEQVDRTGAVCRVVSGLRHPFGLRRSGRIEYLALPIRTDSAPTRLRLRSRSDPDLPLAGYDVFVRNAATAALEPLGRTDWNGEITIPPSYHASSVQTKTTGTDSAGHDALPRGEVIGSAVRLLEVRSSGETLTRFPIVAGFRPAVTANIADDAVRIQVQGFLLEIEDELVDVVARRQILMARVTRRLKADKIDEAGRFLDQLKQLPDRQQLLDEIRRVERTSVSKDPLVRARIARQFKKTKDLLARFLDPKPVNRLQSEYDHATRKRRAAGRASSTAPIREMALPPRRWEGCRNAYRLVTHRVFKLDRAAVQGDSGRKCETTSVFAVPDDRMSGSR